MLALDKLLKGRYSSLRYIGVEFKPGFKVYTYKTSMWVRVGDTLVVPVGDGLSKPRIVTVVKIYSECYTPAPPATFPIRWVISRVDTTSWKEKMRVEKITAKVLTTKKKLKSVVGSAIKAIDWI